MIARLRALFHRPHGGSLRSSSIAVREAMRDLTGPHNESNGGAALNLEQARAVHDGMLVAAGDGRSDASAALRAVLAAHVPVQTMTGNVRLFVRCGSTCEWAYPYPCHTVVVAAQALGVPVPGLQPAT